MIKMEPRESYLKVIWSQINLIKYTFIDSCRIKFLYKNQITINAS